jgi:two-component system chemotaxis response regulator CheB
VVVIGGSAGGLPALTRVVSRLPADLPAAVLAVLHQPATARSRLASILQRAGSLPASIPGDDDPLEESHIYVPAADRHLLVGRGRVRFGHGPRENGHRPALDPLFRSAARHYGAAAVGVVLCGNLDDGSAGLLSIRRHGGQAVVVAPQDCEFRDMPDNAVAAASPQHVVPIDSIAALLTELVHHPVDASPWMGRAAIEVQAGRSTEETDRMTHEEPELWGDDRPGRPSGYSCPDCHGVLWEVDDEPLPRFECRVGHRISAESLLEQRVDEVEGAIWAAVRALEEQASLTRRLWQRAEDRGDLLTAERFRNRAEAAREQAMLLREIALQPRLQPEPAAAQVEDAAEG